MKYIKEDKIIDASEKAYNAIYQECGYEPYEEPEYKTLEDMNVTELKTVAKERGIEGYSKLTKEELLELLQDVE